MDAIGWLVNELEGSIVSCALDASMKQASTMFLWQIFSEMESNNRVYTLATIYQSSFL